MGAPLLALLLALAAARPVGAAPYSPTSIIALFIKGPNTGGAQCPSPPQGFRDNLCTRATELFLNDYRLDPDPVGGFGVAKLITSTPLGVTLSGSDQYLGTLNRCADGTCVVLGANAAPPQTPATGERPYLAGDRVIIRVHLLGHGRHARSGLLLHGPALSPRGMPTQLLLEHRRYWRMQREPPIQVDDPLASKHAAAFTVSSAL